MKLKCKDCGKEFEINQGELDFYKSKGLHTPKRCKKCRNGNKKENKVGNPAHNNASFNGTGYDGGPIYSEKYVYKSTDFERKGYSKRQSSKRISPIAYIIVAAVIVLTMTVASLPNFLSQGSDDASQNATNNTTTISQGNYIGDFEFRTDNYLVEHFEKHGRNMGYDSAEEYLQGANRVINSKGVLIRTQSDLDSAYFLEQTGEFVVVSNDGFIRTYFIPDDGIDYFNRQ